MNDLIEDNYTSTVKRGKITPSTTKRDFQHKILEEFDELSDATLYDDAKSEAEEIADIILVCLNYAKHFDIDIEQELKKKVQFNFNRLD